jgi:hypothetical protein
MSEESPFRIQNTLIRASFAFKFNKRQYMVKKYFVKALPRGPIVIQHKDPFTGYRPIRAYAVHLCLCGLLKEIFATQLCTYNLKLFG